MVDVKNRWAFITGASRGIGKLSAEFLAKQGCNLILHSRELKHTESMKEELKEYGIQVYCVQAELSDLDDVNTMLEEIDRLNVRVDIVLNNAGLQIAYRTDYFTTPVSDYEISFKVNTIAPMMICYHFLPKIKNPSCCVAKLYHHFIPFTTPLVSPNHPSQNKTSPTFSLSSATGRPPGSSAYAGSPWG